ncbi:MAG: hypothetical protein F6K11_01005 [Leptolyngbya sp. SIO3F4]|nr:hypothetical protein [Leptolyngbya sp. SIO3F4]
MFRLQRLCKQAFRTDCLQSMKRPRITLPRLFLFWFVGMVIVLALTLPEKPPFSVEPVSFHVPEDAELYFRNVRSFYYEREEREDAGFLQYRIKSRPEHALLHVSLLFNGLQDEAYIMPETPQQESLPLPFTLRARMPETETWDTLVCTAWDAQQAYLLAGWLYTKLEAEARIECKQAGAWSSLFQDGTDQSSLHKTLEDYFRLVGKLR